MADIDQQQPVSRHDSDIPATSQGDPSVDVATDASDKEATRQAKRRDKQQRQEQKERDKQLRHDNKRRDKQQRQHQRQEARQAVRQKVKDTRAWLATHKTSRTAFLSLATGLGVVAAMNFMLSYVGLYGFAQKDMQAPWVMPALAPIGLDGMTLAGIAATYLLRHATLRVRVFAWFVFGVPTALSVAANIAHASSQHLSKPGIFGYAVAPLLLTLATHACIVVYRHIEQAQHHVATSDTTPRKAVSQKADSNSDISDTTQENKHEDSTAVATLNPSVSRHKAATVTSISKAVSRHNSIYRDTVRQLAAEGKSISDIMTELSDIAKQRQEEPPSQRSAERWTKDLRQAN